MSPDRTPPPLPQTSPSPAAQTPRSGKRGCLIAFAIVASLAVLGLVGICFLCIALVNLYTATAPANIAAFTPTSEDIRSAQGALATLRDATVTGKATQVDLTARDLNTIIAEDPGFRELKGKVYLAIDSSTISVETTISLRSTHLPGLSERWLNVVASFLVTYENDEFSINFQSITSNQRALPEPFLQRFSETISRRMTERFHDNMKRDMTTAGFWMQIKSIRVAENKLVITTRGSP